MKLVLVFPIGAKPEVMPVATVAVAPFTPVTVAVPHMPLGLASSAARSMFLARV